MPPNEIFEGRSSELTPGGFSSDRGWS